MRYRADIDGLRAVAVLSVVSFHLKFGASGGFAGVDIFFVISGYLISSIVYDETAQGSFSVAKFYERRARRILPALIATLVCSFLAALLLFYPSELVAFSKSVTAAILFYANIYFFESSSYFSPSADAVPLLHLWSLGIEEQFYFLFPLLAMLLVRYSQRLLLVVFAAMSVTSAIASQFMVNVDPTAAFYLLPYRGFELLIGCLIALPNVKLPRTSIIAEAGSIVGAICLMLAIFMLGPQTKFPGFAALLPCVGAALIIWSGQKSQTIVSKLLAIDPLVYVGKISYSLYLVHWPVIVFGLRLSTHRSQIGFDLFALGASISLAALSYRFVEQPFRHPNKRTSLRTLSVSALFITTIAALSSVTIYEGGFRWRIDGQIRKVLAYLSYDYRRVYRSRECFLDPDQDFTEADMSGCLPDGAGMPVMLWGDSHAIDLYPGLRESMAKSGYSLGVLTASACAPIIGYTMPGRPKCGSFNDHALPTILSVKPKIVILSASWILSDRTMDQLDATVEDLVNHGIKVVVLGQSPLFTNWVPKAIAGRLQNEDSNKFISDEGLELSRAGSDRIMSARFSGRANIKFISMMQLACPGERCLIVADDGTPMYWDVEHLTETGSRVIAETLAPVILRAF
jgi:peptidoglycan/LPS O-acetylase OafA/YrhL